MNNKRLSQAFLHCLWKAVEHAKSVQSCLTLSDPYRLAPLCMGFSRQQYWSGLPFPSPGDLPEPGIKPRSPSFEAGALTSEPPGKPSGCESWTIKKAKH